MSKLGMASAMVTASAILGLLTCIGPAGATSPPPTIVLQPVSQQVAYGKTATFTAAATNSATEVWQVSEDGGSAWETLQSGTDSTHDGVTTSSFTTGALTRSENGWEFRDAFCNDPTGVPSGIQCSGTNPAVLTAIGSPVVTDQPKSQHVRVGQKVHFSAAASGTPTPTMQWQISKNHGRTWSNVSRQSSTSFTSKVLSTAENGWRFRAVFTNANGSTKSNAATVFVTG